jgi:hypothetical protein
MIDLPIDEMDMTRLRAHLAALREIKASPIKRTSMLREESESIRTKRAPRVKMDVSDLF